MNAGAACRPLRALTRLAAALLVLAAAAPGAAHAQVLLVPNAPTLPGELGAPLLGALTALASGGEALWFNPAGLARERGQRLTASGVPLRWRGQTGLGDTPTDYDAGPGSLAYAAALGSGRGSPHFVLGLGLAMLTQQRWGTRLEQQRTGGAASLPPGFDPGVDVGTAFPEGLSVTDTAEALGELRVLGSSLGLGAAVADWLRLGLVLHVERVSLQQRSTDTAVFADVNENDANSLSGQSQRAWVAAGEALRVRTGAGLQVQLSPGVVLGLALEQPSDALQGSGRVQYQRADRFTIGVGGPGTDHTEFVATSGDGLDFRLDRPRRVRLGLAFESDQVLVEFDVLRTSAQASYTVLPSVESAPPSTLSFQLPALRTSGEAVQGYALGLAFAQNARTTLLLALATEPSPVPPDDPLFRHVDFTSLGTGVYHVRGPLSLSVGVVYRQGRAGALTFPAPDGGESVTADVTIYELAAHLGGSVAF